MEKEQIIKALEWCTQEDYNCEKCPYFSNGIGGMGDMEVLMRDALALINSQEQRIKELAEENDRLSTALAEYDHKTAIRISEEYVTAEAYEELREENERLTRICESYALQYGTATDKEVFLKRERADTVREFAERLGRYFSHDPAFLGVEQRLIMDVVDRIANEILNKNTEEKRNEKGN